MGRRLGQHFLFDPSILRRIADAAQLSAAETVLEIGPGKGTLTRHLAERAGRVIAIEADRALAAALVSHQPAPNVEIIAGDALQVDWPRADVIAGNIPYQITSPLIERALEHHPTRIVFLVQKEVAERLAAAPGSKQYGALSVGVQLAAKVEQLFTVRAGSFSPPPKVESAVVRLTPIRSSAHPLIRPLVQALFQRRRQQLQRSLREFLSSHSPRPTPHARDLLAAAGLPPETRPEQLSPGQFLDLARRIAAS